MKTLKNTNQLYVDGDDELNETDLHHTKMPLKDDEPNQVIYAGFGVKNQPDILNPANDEATDTLLYTDNVTAQHATDEISNDEEPDEFVDDETDEGDDEEDKIEEKIVELGEEEDLGNERY